MNTSKLLPILVLALVLTACGGGSFNSNSGGSSASSPDPGAPVEAPASVAPAGGAPGQQQASDAMQKNTSADLGFGAVAATPVVAAGGAAPEQQQIDRLIIKNADVSLQVENVRDAEAAVRAKVGELGGYIIQVQTSGSDENMTTQMSVRVPSARFDEALSGVQGLAKEVLSRTISGNDVTEEFVDLDSQLRNLEATRDRLLEFLDKAEKVEDALAVNSSLTDIQGQIEQIKGRMQFLRQNAAMSTINVYLQPVPVTPLIANDAWQPFGVAREALSDLIEFGQGLASIAIVIVVWTPVWLPLILLALWGRRKLVGVGKRPSAVPPSEA